MVVDIRPVRKEDYEAVAKELYDNLRLADKLEMVQLHKDTWEYPYYSMLYSDVLYQARDKDGNLLCVTGAAAIECDTGYCVWCLGTKELSRHKREMVRYGRKLMDEYLSRCHELKNFIGVENEEALTFIKHMGAELQEPVKLGDGMFVPFVIRG